MNKSSGFSPFEMMFGNQPTLPIDQATGIPIISEEGHSDLIRMNGDLNRAEASEKYRAKQLPNSTKLTIGDQVLLKRTFREHPKISVKWKTDSQDKPYVAIKKVGPVNYAIENSSGVQKVYHRNMLRIAGKNLAADFSIKPNRLDSNRQATLVLQPIIVRHIEPATNPKLDVRQLDRLPPWGNINHKRFATNALAGRHQDKPNTELLRQSSFRTHSGRLSKPAKRFQVS